MQAQVFLPQRRKNDKLIVGRLYRGRYRLEGDSRPTEVSLGTSDEKEAREKLQKIIGEVLKERSGEIAPRIQRETAGQDLTAVIEDFLKSREALGRDHKYVLGVKQQLHKLASESRWKNVSHITLDSFEKWRFKQSFSPKTLNDYLVTLNAFMNWMLKTGRINSNPIRSADKVGTGDYETRERRAVTWEDLQRLAHASGDRGPLYVFAGLTGLRRGELAKLEWRDLQLDGDKPAVHARATTTKNGRKASLPLHPEAVKALKTLRLPGMKSQDKVFGSLPRIERFRRDLAKAGIPYKDDKGRVFDFHALRVTFGTLLAKSGVSARETMELMRHSDIRLTTHIYTDAGHLPLRDSVLKVTSAQKQTHENTQPVTETHEKRVFSAFDLKERLTQEDLDGMDPERYLAFDSQGNIADWALRLLGGGTNHDLLDMVRGAGFEPATPAV